MFALKISFNKNLFRGFLFPQKTIFSKKIPSYAFTIYNVHGEPIDSGSYRAEVNNIYQHFNENIKDNLGNSQFLIEHLGDLSGCKMGIS